MVTTSAPIEKRVSQTISSLITWDDISKIRKALVRGQSQHRTRVLEQLSKVLGESSKEESYKVRDALVACFATLPESSLIRLLQSPEVHFRLTQQISTQAEKLDRLGFLYQVFAAERCRESSGVLKKGIWTADGDRYFAANASDASEPEADVKALCQLDSSTSFKAPVLSNDTILDFCSPIANRRSDGSLISNTAQEIRANTFSSTEVAEILTAIQHASMTIGLAVPAAQEFMAAMLRSIVLQKDPARFTFVSVSGRAFAGRMIFVNPHLPGITKERFADSLIHESIHAFLYMREQVSPWIPKSYLGAGKLRSPWTDNELRLDSYLHACFVWFALACFWRSEGAVLHFGIAQANLMASKAMKGFASSRHVVPLRPYKHVLNADLVEEIEDMPSHLSQLRNAQNVC